MANAIVNPIQLRLSAPVYYAERGGAPFVNTLTLSIVDNITDPADPRGAVNLAANTCVLQLAFPDAATGFSIDSVRSALFRTERSGNTWSVFPNQSLTFGAATPLTFNVSGVTVSAPIDNVFVVVTPMALAAWTTPLSMKLSFSPAPAATDQPLQLQVDVTSLPNVVYAADQDLAAVPAEARQAFSDRNRTYHQIGLRVTSPVKTPIVVSGAAGFNVRVSLDCGEALGDLVPEAHAAFLNLETVRDYGNNWGTPVQKRQSKSVQWEFNVPGPTFLQGGDSNKYEMLLSGVFPESSGDPEAFANLYIEYQHLDTYANGIAIVPVFKKKPPSIVTFALNPPGPFLLPAQGPVAVQVVWDVANVEEHTDAVVISMSTGDEGFDPTPSGLLRGPQSHSTSINFSPQKSSPKPRGSAVVHVEATRVLLLKATDLYGRSIDSRPLPVEVRQPTVRIGTLIAAPNPAPFEHAESIRFEWTIVEAADYIREIQLLDQVLPPTARNCTVTVPRPGPVTLIVRPVKGGDVTKPVDVKAISEVLAGQTFVLNNTLNGTVDYSLGSVKVGTLNVTVTVQEQIVFRKSELHYSNTVTESLWVSTWLWKTQNDKTAENPCDASWHIEGQKIVCTTPWGPLTLRLDGLGSGVLKCDAAPTVDVNLMKNWYGNDVHEVTFTRQLFDMKRQDA